MRRSAAIWASNRAAKAPIAGRQSAPLRRCCGPVASASVIIYELPSRKLVYDSRLRFQVRNAPLRSRRRDGTAAAPALRAWHGYAGLAQVLFGQYFGTLGRTDGGDFEAVSYLRAGTIYGVGRKFQDTVRLEKDL